MSNNYEVTTEEKKFLEIKSKADKEGFTIVTNKYGTLQEKQQPDDFIPFPVRRKKKKSKIKTDFYRFQIAN